MHSPSYSSLLRYYRSNRNDSICHSNLSSPTQTHLAPRSAITTFCRENGLSDAAEYLLYNNLWGEDKATSGSQCTYLEYDKGETTSWVTS